MTPPSVHARAELAQFESEPSSTQLPVAKPLVRLVKIDGKITAVPVQVEAPAKAHRPVKAVAPLGALEPARSVEPAHAEKSRILNYDAGVSLQNLLQQAVEQNASDLHIHSGALLRIRVDGKFLQATQTVMSAQECKHLIMGILSKSQLNQLEEKYQVDFAYEIKGVGRFRANVYKQQRGFDAVFRVIKPAPPTFADLGLPKEFEKYTEFHQGLMLFTGPAGCGKSSTMAAMADLINKRRPDHILTIEDPIEYVHASDSCNVTQREVGLQTNSFPTALRAALREDPDVIVIGELRDLVTISLAITAAETGHLVMATLHTSNAIRTINRLLSVFPPEQMCQIGRMLSESLKVVISQRLVQRADNWG